MKVIQTCLTGCNFCFLVLSLILFPTTAFGATILVPADQPTIQAGIDAASNGDTVLVADGTYTGEGNKNLDLKGKAITVKSEHGPENCIIDCEGNGRGFYFHNDEGRDSILSGFTITNGNGSAEGGGGIYCNFSSPTITNCIINGNISSSPGGGGIYCTNFSSPVITNCTFSDNIAQNYNSDGGGIYCNNYSSPNINNCIFKNNISQNEYGGAISCHDSSPIITSCTFLENEADGGGAISVSSYSDPEESPSIITNCIFIRNKSQYFGSAISCHWSSPTITNCTFSRNEITYSSNGGAINCGNSSYPTITNCILWQNIPLSIDLINRGMGPLGNPTVSHSDIQGGYEGESNIDADPLFVGRGDYYHLTAGSPCIDTGTSNGAPKTDIDGDLRPQGAGYDMGADEYIVPIPSGKAMPWIPLLLLDD